MRFIVVGARSSWRLATLGLAAGGLLLLTGATASADQAPAGQFLPNEPLPVPMTRAQKVAAQHGFGIDAIPPPADRYQSRVGWLVAASLATESTSGRPTTGGTSPTR